MVAPQAPQNWKLGRRVALASVATSFCLAVANIVGGYLFHSTSVLAAGLEFAGDVVASTFVLFGMIVAAKPADDDHPYGHGRVETLTALAVGAVLFLAGGGICYRALQRINEVHPAPAAWAAIPLVTAVLIRGVMAAVKFRVGKSIRSAALTADAWNDAVDILSAVAALVSLGLTLFNPAEFLAADHYGGFIVGLFVVFTGLRVLRESSLDLMDTMPGPDQMEAIRIEALRVEGVAAIEKCFARKTGLQYHVDIHVEVDPEISVRRSHEIATSVRIQLKENLDWVADALVHIEPAGEVTAPKV